MSVDGTYAAVVDRIVDGETAVLLLEEDGEVVEQLDVGVDALPVEGRHEGARFEVAVADGALVDIEYRPGRERRRRERLREKFDRLSKRLGEE